MILYHDFRFLSRNSENRAVPGAEHALVYPPESGGVALSIFALYAAERGFSFVSVPMKRNSKNFACSPIALFIIICYNQGRNLSVQFGRE